MRWGGAAEAVEVGFDHGRGDRRGCVGGVDVGHLGIAVRVSGVGSLGIAVRVADVGYLGIAVRVSGIGSLGSAVSDSGERMIGAKG